ncbi:RsfA family transcriptional regulator [Gracilibacillus caseinilyticus]|uniref:RsfA family transcriptional regulator n=1 Tax=Gracilibacillus caseinilyticus TaxID=2932256 RepID=A0ABY4ETY9_9BACI|nr:RsfA family transcriptional regulator [Gracilibacillus caseinilyticus]UOQ47337.1 RsfA family transcriptional regulator [Gracilibacillus caseinilyticus]
MAKVRQDAWSHEDDLLLAETVLRHIREGGTQLQAFDEVGDKLNRTSAACGFRWNAEVRQNYEQAVQIAKKQRKDRKRALANQNTEFSTAKPASTNLSKEEKPKTIEEEVYSLLNWTSNRSEPEPQPQPVTENYQEEFSLNLDQVIRYLQYLKKEQKVAQSSHHNHQKLAEENKQLMIQLEQEQKRSNQLEKELITMKEDYQAFMQIVERARKMVVFDEEDSHPVPKFRMDKNGNLEKVAK